MPEGNAELTNYVKQRWTEDPRREQTRSSNTFGSAGASWSMNSGRSEAVADDRAFTRTRPGYSVSQSLIAEDPKIIEERTRLAGGLVESGIALNKQGTYDTLMKVVMGSIGPKYSSVPNLRNPTVDVGSFSKLSERDVDRSSISSSADRSDYMKRSSNPLVRSPLLSFSSGEGVIDGSPMLDSSIKFRRSLRTAVIHLRHRQNPGEETHLLQRKVRAGEISNTPQQSSWMKTDSSELQFNKAVARPEYALQSFERPLAYAGRGYRGGGANRNMRR
ncbi:unnamed protein product [Strongylus vulgaris]|uniref:Uncharacterized protein n=1 Tax=Strongylus vulgaris TaxID=40348 RepID=A0A3P7IJG2_STRVU|nr:unnamed protein product [Strongylus vulgaris]